MYYLYHRLGIMNDIIVSARYSSVHADQKLTRASVLAALKQVVEAHSMLSVVAVPRPSAKKGKHRLHDAMLHRINLEECVEFLDGVEAGPQFFEKLHNQWNWTDDEPTRPWWKVYVLDGRDVVFVFHHLVCDGLSGMTFHRTFIKALNSLPPDITNSSPLENIVTFDPSKTKLFPLAITLSRHKPNFLELIYFHLFFIFMRLIYGKKVLFADLPRAKPYLTSYDAVATPDQRTITNVSTFRISSEKMGSILAACRKHKTTFTPLLNVMCLVTFAAETFPKAKVGMSAYAYSIIKHVNMPKLEGIERRDGVMANLAGGSQHPHFLGQYRDCMVDMGSGQKALDTTSAWELVQSYGQLMQDFMPNRGMRNWSACALIGPNLEDYASQGLSSVGPLMSMTFTNSNLGVFTLGNDEDEVVKRPWMIDDFQWSVPAANGNQGSRGFKFSVAGIKGGDTVINLTYEEGIVSREMAETVLKSTMEKIEAML